MKRQEYDHSKLEGVDVDIETSLKEYGIAWIEGKTDTLFYYGVGFNDDDYEYDRFDFCTFDNDTDVRDDFDWADLLEVARFAGFAGNTTLEQWLETDLTSKIEDLMRYYGPINVFGESDWKGLRYEEIGVADE